MDPLRAALPQVGPRETQDEERHADDFREVLDDVKERSLGPVDVFEDDRQLRGASARAARPAPAAIGAARWSQRRAQARGARWSGDK